MKEASVNRITWNGALIKYLQLSMTAAVEAVRQQRELQPQEVEHLRQRVPTVAHMAQYFKEMGLTNP
jgi:hypothetical protein